VRVTVSVAVLIGGAHNPSHADEVLRLGEEAIGRAKQAGRNRVEVVDIGGTMVPRAASAG